MNAHVKLSPEENRAIARQIFVGASYQEVSQTYGVSTSYAMAQVEKLRKEIARNALPLASVDAGKKIVQEVCETKKRMTVWPLRSRVGKQLGIVAVREELNPSMPFVSILHGEKK